MPEQVLGVCRTRVLIKLPRINVLNMTILLKKIGVASFSLNDRGRVQNVRLPTLFEWGDRIS